MRTIVLVGAAITLSGCGGLESATFWSSSTYVRADGQLISQGQLDADQDSCSSGAESTQHCMLAKGYFLIDAKEADVKRSEFARISETNRRREEAQLAAERARQKELELAARREVATKQKKPPAKTRARSSNSVMR
jgi:hypothetical protein